MERSKVSISPLVLQDGAWNLKSRSKNTLRTFRYKEYDKSVGPYIDLNLMVLIVSNTDLH